MTQSRVPSRILVPLGLTVCLSLFGDLTLYAVLVTQLDEVGLSLGSVGIMLGVNRLIRIPGNPLGGVLLDRWGRRRPFIIGMLLGVLSTAGYALARGFWPFLISRLAWGIAWTLINVGAMAMVVDVSAKANRGRLTGLYNTWMLAGLAVGPVAGGFLVDLFGFRPAMLSCAGITAIGLAVAVVALPETAHPADGNTHRQTQQAPNLRRRSGRVWRQFGTLLHTNPGLVTASSLYLIIQFSGSGVVLSTMSLLLQQCLSESVSLNGLTLGLASVSGILLAMRSLLASVVGPLAGHLSDVRVARWPVILGSLVVGSAGFGLLSFATSLWTIVLAIALGAVSTGAVLATLTAYVGDLTPPGRQGMVMGAYEAVGDVGSTAGPFLAFALLSVVNLQWIYLLCSLTFLAGLWLAWRSRGAPP